MAILGVDLSSHDGVPDFNAIKAGGYAFVVLKVTGGDQYANPYFPQQYAAARAAGLLVGLYHYDSEPTVHQGTADQEAANFLAHIPNSLPNGTFIALDAEETVGRDPARYRRWLDLVRQATGRRGLFYSYPDFLSRDPHTDWSPVVEVADLWFASYDGSEPAAPAGWPKITIWQRSGGEPVPGVAVDADVDVLEVSMDDLIALGTPVAADATNLNPGFPGALQPQGNTVLNGVDFGGNAICVEAVTVQVRNAEGQRYTRRWVGYHLEDWVEIQ